MNTGKKSNGLDAQSKLRFSYILTAPVNRVPHIPLRNAAFCRNITFRGSAVPGDVSFLYTAFLHKWSIVPLTTYLHHSFYQATPAALFSVGSGLFVQAAPALQSGPPV